MSRKAKDALAAFVIFIVMIGVIDAIVYFIFKAPTKWILVVDGVVLIVWSIVLLTQLERQQSHGPSNKNIISIIDKAIEEEADDDIDYYPG